MDGGRKYPVSTTLCVRFSPGSRVLDLCCGTGAETGRIRALGYEPVGIDFSEECLKIARDRNPDIAFFNADMLSDYSFIGPVDAVVIITGLVHVEQKDLRMAFSRMQSVLVPQGQLFVTVREGQGRIEARSTTVIDGERCDRNFIGHSLPELTESAKGLFTFLREDGDDGTGWHNYIFRRD